MSYFEKTKLTDSSGILINPVREESLTLLRRIFQLLKPLSMVTGGGSNRLNVDVTTVTNVANIATGALASVTTVNNLGGITTFDLLKAMSRTAYSNGIRSKIV